MSKTIIYPGTFDPITLGHIDLVIRASQLFHKIIVAVAASSRKVPLFSLAQRLDLAQQALADYPQVVVHSFDGLLIEFAQQHKVAAILRGLRAVSDFDYELQLAAMNRHLAPGIETFFMAPSEHYAFLSATMVREIAQLGGDVSAFVRPEVKLALAQHYRKGE